MTVSDSPHLVNTEFLMPFFSNPGALVGLENTSYTVLEDAGAVEICAVISFPEITCPVSYHFEVVIRTISGTAGIDSV